MRFFHIARGSAKLRVLVRVWQLYSEWKRYRWNKVKKQTTGAPHTWQAEFDSLWDKRLLQRLDNAYFPRQNINNNSTLQVLIAIPPKQQRGQKPAVILKRQYLLTVPESGWPLLNGMKIISSKVGVRQHVRVFMLPSERSPSALLKPFSEDIFLGRGISYWT